MRRVSNWRHDGQRPIDRTKVIGVALAVAMVVAPFLALLYGWTAGLGVMALALAATSYLALAATPRLEPAHRGRVVAIAAINGALALVCVAALIDRLI
jgi:hypothetical protein